MTQDIHQTTLVRQKDWDIMCILDACRYDVFKEVYGKYLTGKLQRVKSPASSTAQWMTCTFDDSFKDVLYVSGHPAINSNGIRFKYNEWFWSVLDVWKWKWDEDLGTVPPDAVTEYVISSIERFSEHKIIAHYMQPHAPYLTTDVEGGDMDIIMIQMGVELNRNVRPYEGQIIYRSQGEEALRKAYRENLEEVLKAIVPLANLDKKVILTSDHGELLGEAGLLFHPKEVIHPVLRNVPWFELNGRVRA